MSTAITTAIEPTMPAVGEPVRVRVRDASGCDRIEGTRVERVPAAHELQVELYLSDACRRTTVPVERVVDLGTLDRGAYRVVSEFCEFGPLGWGCRAVSEQQLVVGGGLPATSVPATSLASIVPLALALLFGGVYALVERSR